MPKLNQPDFEALNTYISEVRDTPLQLHQFDCFMFTNTAFQRMHGEGWADDWSGKYISDTGLYKTKSQLIKTFGYNSLESAIDAKLTRIAHVPPRGSLVTALAPPRWSIDRALGISIGTKAAFLGKSRLIFLPIQKIENAWVKT
jgi:hypothetical protein